MDLIDREALKKEFCKDIMGGLNWERIIDNAPTVEIFCHYQYDGEVKEPCVEAPCLNCERPHGKWLTETIDGFVRCSECKWVDILNYKFCPNCGADMRESNTNGVDNI